MGTDIVDKSGYTEELLQRAAEGDDSARQELLMQYSDRLKAMIRLRLNRRLRGRLDPSDVLQEAFLDVTKRLDECLQDPPKSFFLWLRKVTVTKLTEIHRHHLDVQARDAEREISILGLGEPAADSVSLAAHLLGRITSPSHAAIKAEERFKLQQLLDSLDPVDREVIALRHFEQLDSAETAAVLGLSKSGASSRYVRAMRRLHSVLADGVDSSELSTEGNE